MQQKYDPSLCHGSRKHNLNKNYNKYLQKIHENVKTVLCEQLENTLKNTKIKPVPYLNYALNVKFAGTKPNANRHVQARVEVTGQRELIPEKLKQSEGEKFLTFRTLKPPQN